ncbi:hypothetical protein Kfla_6950 [Kribbella flavida DSM 17836]|uniref:DUF3152 domain-containing protein n=1 Tax=Kribbella flavida (strain DSM 17836 / JCM 10339 / NBRC 14399) TaxID=479435 RepID=D2Q3R6_KRIFD|nr:DUF3152 domain-containing protein [Kribbella flavida]ADB35938.1 hypothetical protein Kfla_6950 [Kribbella flavida DSM 17836]
MRKLRVAGLGVVVAVVVAGLVQLPASPFARHDLSDREPVGVVTARPSAAQPGAPAGEAERQDDAAAEPSPGSGQASQSTLADGEVISYPQAGGVSYTVLPGDAATIGTGGKLLTFEIAIENGIAGIDRPALADFVRSTYAAPQGWTAGGKWRFRQVGPGQSPDFTLMFVTPATRDLICGGGYDRYTSCRIGDRVVLNIARWVHGVPNYGGSLTAYRQYMVNHETGHRLGEAHELCPGPGQPAPVMQQQTLGLHGCVAYAWPHRDGRRYEGRLGRYNDPIPAA